jgi:acetyltransferase-like isoleucine patch superfamily enzyme
MLISPFAIVEPQVSLGMNCSVGPFTVIRSGTTLGDNVSVGSHCEIGLHSDFAATKNLSIGDGANIRSHSIIYSGSLIGSSFTTGHTVTIRENSTIGNSVQVGTLSDIQGDCFIGDFSRLHSNVHIGKLSRIGKFVWIYPYVVLTNDPTPPSDRLEGVTVEDFVVIATMTTVLPGVTIGFGSLVGAHSVVHKNVPPEVLALGSPSRVIRPISEIGKLKGETTVQYPWYTRFSRGYPENLADRYLESRKGFIS